MGDKPHLNIVTVGHVDHGKSTLVGRLLFETGAIREDEIRKLKETAAELKKETFEFAFVMDNQKEERERGVTIDITHKEFKTDKYHYTLIDAPGHKDFVKNMITGTSQADVAIIVCSAKDGIQDQTKEHTKLVKILGVPQVIVAVNKMDSVEYKEDSYKKTVDDMKALMMQSGFSKDHVEDIKFVPTSGYEGDNIAKSSEKMSWYSGPTIVGALDAVKTPERSADKPLRLPIQSVYSVSGVGAVPVGMIKSGKLNLGDKIVFVPSGAKAEVKTIEMHHQQVNEAGPGDNIGFNIRGAEKKDIERGDVACHEQDAAKPVKEFTAQIVVMNHPTVMTVGYTPVFHINTAQIACTITEIVSKLDPATGKPMDEKVDKLKQGDAAIVKITPAKPVVIETQSESPLMSRFAIRDMGQTIAAGMCIEKVTE